MKSGGCNKLKHFFHTKSNVRRVRELSAKRSSTSAAAKARFLKRLLKQLFTFKKCECLTTTLDWNKLLISVLLESSEADQSGFVEDDAQQCPLHVGKCQRSTAVIHTIESCGKHKNRNCNLKESINRRLRLHNVFQSSSVIWEITCCNSLAAIWIDSKKF